MTRMVRRHRQGQRKALRLESVMGRLLSMNMLIYLSAFVTSPILARSLGPVGRGELAAIAAIIGVAPWIAELGLTNYLTVESARGELPQGTIFGSVVPIAVAISALLAACAVPIAHLIGHGRPTVVLYVELGLYLLPVSVLNGTLYGAAIAQERWTAVMVARLLSTGGSAIVIVLLALLGKLTVSSVAVTYICLGTLGNVPFLTSTSGSWPWSFDLSVARRAIAFGVKAWLTTVAATGNLQLDQVLMAGFVSSRQLGWYALAATIASASSSFVSAACSAIVPRVAAGDHGLVGRASRTSTLIISAGAGGAAIVSPFVVPLVFGSRYDPAIPMLLILLAAVAVYAPGQVLGTALVLDGHPSGAVRAQVGGLIVTVPGLILVLPTLAGMGAAIVTFVSYLAVTVITVIESRKRFDLSPRQMLVVQKSDVLWVLSRVWASFPKTGTKAAVGSEVSLEPEGPE